MNTLVFDIETGPLPWTELEKLYEAPPALPPFSEDMVKYGNLKDATKRQEKFDATRAEYERKLAAEATSRAEHRQEFIGKAALSPLTGRVLAIGIVTDSDYAILGDDGQSEAEMLDIFWQIVRKRTSAKVGQVIGFNSHNFDLPFLMRRSWFAKVAVPESLLERNRYWSPVFIDLMQMWACGGREYVKLDSLCRAFGIGGKPEGVDGGMFANLWEGNADSRQQAIAYLKNDLDMTWALAERMGVIA